MNFQEIGGRMQLEYPVKWQYKIIGMDEQRLRDAIAGMSPDDDYSLTPSHVSAKGKYTSLNLELIVNSEAHRNALFHSLKAHPDIRMVL